MKKQELIKMLNQEQDKLWEALKNSETVFGVEHEATKMARARWVTAVDMSSIVKLNLNQDDNI
jgi:hypothetical protein